MYTKDQGGSTIRNKDIGTDTNLTEDFRKVRDKVTETGAAISQTASHAKARAEELLHTSLKDVKERTTYLQENVVTYVMHNPVKSVGLAVLAGLIVAQLLRK